MNGFIELTNLGNEQLKGDPLLLNPAFITCVYEQPTDGGSRRTIVFCAHANLSWYVEESYNEVKRKIKEASDA